ncbi:MAG: hypothetical protein IJ680_03285 [Paludibacteraceae bacterium]|nr:hypothetical protein [Paludibacteraceae bacterium]
MKRIFYLLAIGLLVASCRGEEGPMGPQGPRGQNGLDGSVQIGVYDYYVSSSEWLKTNQSDNNYWYADFDIPELTSDIYNNGVVQIYREYDTGTADASQVLLPATRHYEYLQDEATNTWGIYSETTDYEYWVGRFSVYVTPNDFNFDLAPDDMQLRVVLMR